MNHSELSHMAGAVDDSTIKIVVVIIIIIIIIISCKSDADVTSEEAGWTVLQLLVDQPSDQHRSVYCRLDVYKANFVPSHFIAFR